MKTKKGPAIDPTPDSPEEKPEVLPEAATGAEKPKKKSPVQGMKGVSIEQWLCWSSLGVAGLMFLLFGLDLVLKVPFGKGIGAAVDIIIILASLLLGYLSWNAARDLR